LETIKSDLKLVVAEADAVEATISQRANPSVTLLRYNADKAVSEGRFADAMEAHDAIVALDGVSWRTVLIKAQILLADMKLEEASEVLAEAIASGQSNAIVLRIYGRTLIELGHIKDGIDSLATAFQNSPGNAQTALDYSTALFRNGKAADALQVLRRSAPVGRSNAAFLRRWLALESQIGSSHVALQERIRIWNGNPAMWENAVELGKLLITADVDWRSIRDPKTDRLMFNEREWTRLSKKDQNKYADQVRKQRGIQSEEIFSELMSRPNASPIVFMARADTLESLGKRDEALEILKKRVTGDDASVGPIERSMMAVDIARRHLEVAEFDEANIWIDNSRELQPEGNPVGDKSLMSLWQVRGKPIKLAEAIKNVIELDQTEGALKKRAINNRLLIRALLDAGESEQANELYIREFKDSEKYQDLILLGALHVELARSAFFSGEEENAQIAFDDAVETFNQVASEDPGSIEPPLQLSRLYELRHQWRGRQSDIEIAIEHARSALANVQTSWLAQQLLCVLLIRDEQLEAASGALEEYLARVPGHDKARFMLVRMYESMDKQDRAVELCQEAVDRDPYSVAWNVRLGKLRGTQGRFNDAAGAFKRLFDMTQDPTVARFYVDSKLRRDPPDHQAVLTFARSNVKLIREDPYLAGAYAATLAYAGNAEKAFSEMEESYVRFRDAGASAMAMQQLVSWLPRILQKTGDSKDIAEKSEELINTFSNGNVDLGSRMILASTWVTEGADGRSRAIDHLRAIVAQDKGSHNLGVQPITNLGGLLIEMGDCEGALAEFKRALSMQPNSVTLLNNLAYTRATCDGDLQQAMREIKKASDLDPLNASVLDTLGFIHLKQGEYEAADVAFRRSLNRRNAASSLIHLAEVRIAGKKYDEAETLLKSAGDLKPSISEQQTISKLIKRIETEKGSR
jgi:tetratricopeptide (TPR) repeat protein